jgi:hypothetical protein
VRERKVSETSRKCGTGRLISKSEWAPRVKYADGQKTVEVSPEKRRLFRVLVFRRAGRPRHRRRVLTPFCMLE